MCLVSNKFLADEKKNIIVDLLFIGFMSVHKTKVGFSKTHLQSMNHDFGQNAPH